MDNTVTTLLRTHADLNYGEHPEVRTVTIPTTVEVEVPVAVSQEQIVAVLREWFERPGAELGRGEESCEFRAGQTATAKARCAVGVFIPDALYARVQSTGASPEGYSVRDWTNQDELSYLRPHAKFLETCQNLHDTSESTTEFIAKLDGLSRGLRLVDEDGFVVRKPAPPVNRSDFTSEVAGVVGDSQVIGDDEVPF